MSCQKRLPVSLRMESIPAVICSLIAPPQLQRHFVMGKQVMEIVGLQELVGKLCERDPLFRFEAVFDHFFREHDVDAKMFSHITQKVDECHGAEPRVVVQYEGAGCRVEEIEDLLKVFFYAPDVIDDRGGIEKRPLRALAGRVSDAPCGPSKDDMGRMAKFLEPA